MKIKTFTLTFLFFLMLATALPAQTWGYVSTIQNEYMRKVFAKGLDTVFVVGENGLIARSPDRALTWQKQHPVATRLNDIVFSDSSTGFVVGDGGVILKTADAGDSWTPLPSGTTKNINALAVTNGGDVWAVGDSSLVLRSTDKGSSWQRISVLLENNRRLLDVAFRNNLGYLTGDYATVYKTQDLGATWEKQNLVENPDATQRCYAVNIMESKTFLMMNGVLFVSNDRNLWEILDSSDSDDVITKGMFYFNDNKGYLCYSAFAGTTSYSDNQNEGYLPFIFVTYSGGGDGSWQRTDWNSNNIRQGEYPANLDQLDIQFANDTIGYAIFGKTMLLTPVPAWAGITGDMKTNKITVIEAEGGGLSIKSGENPFSSVEIYDISGRIFTSWKWATPLAEAKLEKNNLPQGICLIKVRHSDSSFSITKYVNP